jgi:ferredoxin
VAHHTVKSAYVSLARRLNKFPQGAPPSELLFKILAVIFSEEEARLVAQLPLRPFTARRAARIWKVSELDAERRLENLASRALLFDVNREGATTYVVAPPVAGFFEMAMMHARPDIDQRALAELFHEYVLADDGFLRALMTEGHTQFGRMLVHEPALSPENELHVLDYERASHVIESASHRAVILCYCRHTMVHLDRACDAPLEVCMAFNTGAEYLIHRGHARSVETSEAMELLRLAYERNLVQFAENVRERVNFMCNCCGCCCEAMLAARRFAILQPVHTTSFMPRVDVAACNGCGTCVKMCPVEAISLQARPHVAAVWRARGVEAVPVSHSTQVARVDDQVCLGCGVCARVCARRAVALVSRPQRVITPLNSVHRTVVMAIERGTLQHLVFDNQALASHRAMAALLGAVLRLPPVKQLLATQQMRSRYLERLVERNQTAQTVR